MAKKRRKPEGEKPKRRGRPKRAADDLADLPDWRALEGQMWQALPGLRSGGDADTPQAKTQELLYQAFHEPDQARRLQLAREALAVSPDCADAYVLLAEHAPTRKEALRLYEQGVAAGERALGPRAFQEDAGHFWGLLETRPYMRARLGLAHALWTAGRRDEAIQHLQDMLRLNPNDNQGVRYTLAGFLLSMDRDEDLARLLEQYPDEGSATWAYTKALLAFRREGDTEAARRLLKQAKKANKHVPDYLLGRKFPSMDQPPYYSPGAESEALEYIGGFLAGWKATPGAVDWLRGQDAKTKKRKAAEPEAKGPLTLVKNWLNQKLGQTDDVWQADVRQLPNPVQTDGRLVRPWMVLVTSRNDDLILAHEITQQEPSLERVWDTLVQAMQHPMMGEPHRPAELQVRPAGRWEALKPHLAEIDVSLVVTEELDQLGAVVAALSEHLGEEERPGLLDVPGVTPEQAGRFYEAAAFFYRQAPWRKVGYESAVRVECAKYESGPWYAVLMGQSGLTMGLALYEDLDLLRRLWTGDRGEEENARETVATTVTFDDETDVPFADVEAARRYGWPVARPDAYPSAFRKERGLSMRPPLAWELNLLAACLRAIPGFVDRRRQDDATPETVTVPAADGELTLTLAWVVEDETP
jgi:tetratricopeptide (TPR) repeat protein